MATLLIWSISSLNTHGAYCKTSTCDEDHYLNGTYDTFDVSISQRKAYRFYYLQ